MDQLFVVSPTLGKLQYPNTFNRFVKSSIYILQNTPSKTNPSRENRCSKAGFFPIFWRFCIYFYTIFAHHIGILHHLALLEGVWNGKFHRPENRFQSSKSTIFGHFSLKIPTVFRHSVYHKFLKKVQNASSYAVFCCIQHCVLQEIALRFARDSTAFCTRQHCILQEIALHFAAFSHFFSKNHGLSQRKFGLSPFTSLVHFHPNKPSRESIICERMAVGEQKWHSQC